MKPARSIPVCHLLNHLTPRKDDDEPAYPQEFKKKKKNLEN